jgi:hypothetical protein
MLTLGQCKTSDIANVASVNVNDPEFAQKINSAVEMLMDLAPDAGWWGQVESMNGLVAGGKITWAFKIDAVLGMNINNHAVELANQWYSFTPTIGNFSGLVSSDRFIENWLCGGRRESVVEFSGTQPMFDGPSLADPFSIQVTADNPADYGKAVTIYGRDTNGQEVFSNQFDGTANAIVPQRGCKLILAAVAPVTPNVFSSVTAVTKDITIGEVRAWKYTTAPGRLLAIWRGSQTSPQFLFSRLANVPNDRYFRFSALVKLGFEPVSHDSDIVSLGNRAAIKSMVQANKRREAGDTEGADEAEKDAIRRLNMEMETRFPADQIPIRNSTFGMAEPIRRRLF